MHSILFFSRLSGRFRCRSWLHVFIFLRTEPQQITKIWKIQSTAGGRRVFWRTHFDVNHFECSVECELVVRTTGFGREAAEPTHEGHLVVSRNLSKEKAIFGRRGGGRPEFAPGR